MLLSTVSVATELNLSHLVMCGRDVFGFGCFWVCLLSSYYYTPYTICLSYLWWSDDDFPFCCDFKNSNRSHWHTGTPEASTQSPFDLTTQSITTGRTTVNTSVWSGAPPTQPSRVCHDNFCLNGGTCRQLQLPSGALFFHCDCPLHFSGRLCEKGRPLEPHPSLDHFQFPQKVFLGE